MKTVHFVLPGDVDDPTAPSGGNRYDSRLRQGLVEAGWQVRSLPVPGAWPRPDRAGREALAGALLGVPDDGLVLLDGLVACGVPDVVGAAAGRLRLAVLVHLPLADETGLAPDEAAELDARERATLRAAAAVVATSAATGRRLVDHHGLASARVHVAAPGADVSPISAGTPTGARLLCVASVTPRKGHDVLVEALSTIADPRWSCVCAGAGELDRLRRLARERGVGERVRFVGPLTGGALATAYADADLLVLPSRAETYGMVVTEALSRGIPVLATAVGGIPEALGWAPGGDPPGILVPPDDVAALAAALRRWLGEPDLRERLRAAARARRETLDGWDATARAVADALGQTR